MKCPVCQIEPSSGDRPVLGTAVNRGDDGGVITAAQVRPLGSFHRDCWEAFCARYPGTVAIETCDYCHGVGTVIVPGVHGESNEVVDCHRCRASGWTIADSS